MANIELLNDIASGHKFALKDIKKDEIIIKYAEAIASASCDISTGNGCISIILRELEVVEIRNENEKDNGL